MDARNVKLLILISLFSIFSFINSSQAQKSGRSFSPLVPKTWDHQALASLELPLATTSLPSEHISSDYYYRMPVRPVYKSFPIYAPGKEPPGYFEKLKDVPIAKDTVGWFAVLIGRATSESLDHPAGKVAGWPSLYGYMMDSGNSTSGYVYEYLQGQSMDGQPKASAEWIKLWGIYRIPEKTGRIRLFLRPGCKTGKTPDTCASRFRDVGIYLFAREDEAKTFVSQY